MHFTEKLFEGLVVPFFVIYASQRLEPEFLGSGLLAVAITAAVFGLGGGSLADQFGRRAILLPSEATKTLTLIILALCVAYQGNMILIFFLYFVVAAFNAVVSPVGEALTLDAAAPGDIKKIYAVLYWLTNLGRSIGTILGVLFFEYCGLAVLIGITSVFSLISAHLVINRLTETYVAKPHENISFSILKQYRDVLKDGTMMLYVLAGTLNHGIAVQLAYYISTRLAREFPGQTIFSIGSQEIVVTGVMMFGILRLQTNFIAIFGVGIMQKITKNIKPGLLFLIGPLIAACAFAVMMVSNSAWTLIAAMTVYTLTEIAYTPMKQSLLAQIAPDSARARYAAVRAFDFRLALIIGALFITLSAYFSSVTLAGFILVMGGGISVMLLTVWYRLNPNRYRSLYGGD